MYDITKILKQNERKQTTDYLIEQQRTKIVLQESRMAQSPSRRLEQQIIVHVGAQNMVGSFFSSLAASMSTTTTTTTGDV
jgi:hypothetical protein